MLDGNSSSIPEQLPTDHPLIIAVIQGDLAKVKEEIINANGFPLLHFAAAMGQREIVEYLVENNVQTQSSRVSEITANDLFTPVSYQEQWSTSVPELNLDKLIAVLYKKAALASRGYRCYSPLEQAAFFGHLEIVQYLVEKNPESLFPADSESEFFSREGSTALFVASLKGHLEVIDYLTERQGSMLQEGQGEYKRATPLSMALVGRKKEVVSWFINNEKRKGRTTISADEQRHFSNLMHCAAQNNLLDVIENGLSLGYTQANRLQITESAIRAGHLAVVAYFFEKQGIAKTPDFFVHGMSFIKSCLRTEHLPILKYIIDECLSPRYSEGFRGTFIQNLELALIDAINNKKNAAATCLASSLVQYSSPSRALLEFASSYAPLQLLKQLIESYQSRENNHPLNEFAPNLLMNAVERGNIENARYLINLTQGKKAIYSVNQCVSGRSLLSVAVSFRRMDILQLLVSNNARVLNPIEVSQYRLVGTAKCAPSLAVMLGYEEEALYLLRHLPNTIPKKNTFTRGGEDYREQLVRLAFKYKHYELMVKMMEVSSIKCSILIGKVGSPESSAYQGCSLLIGALNANLGLPLISRMLAIYPHSIPHKVLVAALTHIVNRGLTLDEDEQSKNEEHFKIIEEFLKVCPELINQNLKNPYEESCSFLQHYVLLLAAEQKKSSQPLPVSYLERLQHYINAYEGSVESIYSLVHENLSNYEYYLQNELTRTVAFFLEDNNFINFLRGSISLSTEEEAALMQDLGTNLRVDQWMIQSLTALLTFSEQQPPPEQLISLYRSILTSSETTFRYSHIAAKNPSTSSNHSKLLHICRQWHLMTRPYVDSMNEQIMIQRLPFNEFETSARRFFSTQNLLWELCIGRVALSTQSIEELSKQINIPTAYREELEGTQVELQGIIHLRDTGNWILDKLRPLISQLEVLESEKKFSREDLDKVIASYHHLSTLRETSEDINYQPYPLSEQEEAELVALIKDFHLFCCRVNKSQLKAPHPLSFFNNVPTAPGVSSKKRHLTEESDAQPPAQRSRRELLGKFEYVGELLEDGQTQGLG